MPRPAPHFHAIQLALLSYIMPVLFLLQGLWTCPGMLFPLAYSMSWFKVAGLMPALQKGRLWWRSNTLSKVAPDPPATLWVDLLVLLRTYFHLKLYCVFTHLFVCLSHWNISSWRWGLCLFHQCIPSAKNRDGHIVGVLTEWIDSYLKKWRRHLMRYKNAL